MSLTQPSLKMIRSEGEEGDVVRQTPEGLAPQRASESDAALIDTFKGDYDKQTGMLIITINDHTIRIPGLPTETNLATGATGPRGKTGKAGTAGRNGRDGAKGDQGCDGPKGDRGPRGSTGATGERGIQGVIGPVGPTGPTGPTGNAGLDGAEPEYFAGVRSDDGSHNFTETDAQGNTTQGRSPYIRMVRSGAMIEWGRFISDAGTEEVSVLFSEAFKNRVTAVLVFFTDPYSFQAENYEIGEYITINSDIGGFTIGVKGTFSLPLSDLWDFTWVALGD